MFERKMFSHTELSMDSNATTFFYQALVGCSPEADQAFGPIVAVECRQGFDFTLYFEQSILSIVPSVILLALFPIRFYKLYRSSVKTVPDSLHGVKAITAVFFALTQLALLILWATPSSVRTRASLPSAALCFIDALVVSVLSYYEHNRSVRPSALLNIYLLSTLLCDIAQARTLYLRHDESSISVVFTISIGLKLALLILEAQEKRSYLKAYYVQQLSEEEKSGLVFNRTFFWWLNPLFLKGFSHLLSFDDLYIIDHKLSSEKLRNKMQLVWDRRVKPESRYTLPWLVAKFLRGPLLWAMVPRICLIGFEFAQPFLITRVISFVDQPADLETNNLSYGLIAVAAIIYLGIAFTTVHYKHLLFRSITMFRGAVVGLIYNRTLILHDGVYDESAAITLMSTDIDRIAISLQLLHETWPQLLEVAIGIALLARQLGWVCVFPLIVVGLSSVGSSQVALMVGERQKVWAAAVQRRVAITSSMLGSMKSVKMMGLGETMTNVIHEQRVRELNLSKRYRWMTVWLNVFAIIPTLIAPVVTFIAFAIQAKLRGSDSLSTNQAFTSLAIIFLVSSPASLLLSAIPVCAASMGCFDRIQKFLLAPTWADQRRFLNKRAGAALETLRIPKPSIDAGIELQHMQPSQSAPDGLVVLLDRITLRPSPTSDPVLQSFSLDLKVATTTLVVGPVGCGKTVLMKAILGELPCESGDIFVSSKSMAYCSQTPWLLNTGVQQSICGLTLGSAVDEEWYRRVLHACALDQDLSQLPDGDQSVIGSRGLTLSGGQKQRLALARAVYARKDIVLLDDVLSALDSKTEKLVVDRLLGPHGLFRKLKTTVILITHATRHLPLADHIVVLNSTGQIAEQGTYNDLKSHRGFVADLMTRPSDREGTQSAVDRMAASKIKKTADDVMDLTRKTGDFAVYGYYFRSIGLPNALIFLGCIASFAFSFVFPQIWLKWWTDDNGAYIGKYTSVYTLLGVLAILFDLVVLWMMFILIVPHSAMRLHYILLKTVMRAPQSFFAETDTGVTLNRFSQDMTLIDSVLPTAVLVVCSNSALVIGQTALISLGSTYVALTIPFCLVGVYLLQKFYLRTSRQLRFMDLEARSPVFSHFLESLEGLSTIRAFGWQEQSKETSIKHLDASQRPYYLLYCIQRWLNLALDLLVAALAIIVIALAVRLRSSTSPGLIGISLNNILTFNQILSHLIDYWTQLETSLGAIARLKTFEAQTTPEAKPGEDVIPPEEWPERGAVEIRNIVATYGSNAIALQDISMSIQPGQKIGICGRTGSGKSSLLLTLLRLLDLSSGSITVDGLDLSTIPRELIRSRMVAIPQDPFILSGSVRLNADPSGKIANDLIIESLKKIHLWPIIQPRGGLDADMQSQVQLSHGQRQLFCLARAILRKSKILVLDEATSSVDTETDKLMQRIIREEFKEYTIITVAHRLDTIMDADRIAVLEMGKLVEFGSPEELLQRRGSAFGELYGR